MRWQRRRPAPGLPTPAEADDRLRSLVEGLERACARGDRAQVERLATGSARGRLLDALGRVEAAAATWEPARTELRWRAAERSVAAAAGDAAAPAAWVRLRLRDGSAVRCGRRQLRADGATAEVVALVETGAGPWRLARVVRRPDP